MDEGIGSKSTSTADNDNIGNDEDSTKATEDTETPMELDDTSAENSEKEQNTPEAKQEWMNVVSCSSYSNFKYQICSNQDLLSQIIWGRGEAYDFAPFSLVFSKDGGSKVGQNQILGLIWSFYSSIVNTA